MQGLWNLLNNCRYRKILMLIGYCLALLIFIFAGQHYVCPFKYFLNIPCPGCGMTRAIFCILHLNFIGALKYNILSIIVFLWLVLYFIFMIYDLIFSKDFLNKFLHMKLKSYHYAILVIMMLLSWFINIKRGI
jgi:hypothetical protein